MPTFHVIETDFYCFHLYFYFVRLRKHRSRFINTKNVGSVVANDTKIFLKCHTKCAKLYANELISRWNPIEHRKYQRKIVQEETKLVFKSNWVALGDASLIVVIVVCKRWIEQEETFLPYANRAKICCCHQLFTVALLHIQQARSGADLLPA